MDNEITSKTREWNIICVKSEYLKSLSFYADGKDAEEKLKMHLDFLRQQGYVIIGEPIEGNLE